MHATPTSGPTLTTEQIEQLVTYGDKQLDWRCIGATPALCMVKIEFTVQPRSNETKPGFEQRMIQELAPQLSRSGYPVEHHGLRFHGHGNRFWAVFCCRTPQYKLPVPVDGACQLS